MSNIASVDLRSVTSLDIPVQNLVYMPLDGIADVEGGGRLFGIIDMPLFQEICGKIQRVFAVTDVIGGITLGVLSSEGSMAIGNLAFCSIAKMITNRRTETLETRMGYALGGSLWGYFVDTLGSSYFINGMKLGSIISALGTAMAENSEFQHAYTYDEKCWAVAAGLSTGGFVIYTLRSNDISFALSLAAGALTANRITELYCRINARLA